MFLTFYNIKKLHNFISTNILINIKKILLLSAKLFSTAIT